MKFIFIHAPCAVGSSVHQKVTNQARALSELGHVVRSYFFVLKASSSEGDIRSDNVCIVNVQPVKGKLFRSIRNHSKVHRAVLRRLPSMDPEAVVIFRYPRANFYLWRIAQFLKGRLVFEHVTNEIDEISLYLKSKPQGGLVSRILGSMQFYYLPLLFERTFGALARKHAILALCNSDEIAKYQKEIASGPYETMVYGDAVWAEDFPKSNLPEGKGEVKMIFLKGSSTVHDYNGLDRVLNGISNYRGNKKLKLFLFGHQLKEELNLIQTLMISDNVELGDTISKADQDRLFQEVHLGISALAVHRKGIRATTTIKSREYCARGVPFIYAYGDPDFEANFPAALKLPLDDTALDFEAITKWYDSLDKQAAQKALLEHAKNVLHFKMKLERVVDKLKELNM